MAVGRRKFIRVTSYLTALCIVLAASGIYTHRAKADYEAQLSRIRLASIASLCEYAHDLSAGLRLLAVSAGESQDNGADFISARALGAISSATCFNSGKIKNIDAFLNGVYDFAQSFDGDESQRTAALKLSDYAQELYYHLSDVSMAVLNDEYSLTEYGSVYERGEAPYFEDYLDYSNGNEQELFSSAFPAAVSSGGFELLNGRNSISEQQARSRASAITGIEGALWRYDFADDTQGTGIYCFSYGDIRVEISKKGGFLRKLVNPSPCAASLYSVGEAEEKAVAFIKARGYPEMRAVDSRRSEFSAAFVFAPLVNGVLLLTACVEVEVCLSAGVITYFNAENCLANYRLNVSASDEKPDLSGIISPRLALSEILLCLADIGGEEKLCYLAVCSLAGEKVFVFVDYHSLRPLKSSYSI